ncbi:MAG: methyltransferase domain-containing protein, partial [Candidatus Obscuribacterales bacterium]|nr:methyltransferase domain-containing protein [Candidatus Obscuribacterales bacterium]
MYNEDVPTEELFRCAVCLDLSLKALIDFGNQPISNRFIPLKSASSRSKETPPVGVSVRDQSFAAQYHLRIGSCTTCLTVQLIEAPPPELLRLPNGGASYTEPEQHLDDVAAFIASFAPISKTCQILGLSPIDGRLLHKLKDSGFGSTVVLKAEDDLQIKEPGAGIETIQERVTKQADELTGRLGPSKLVVARAIVEHAHDLQGFLKALKTLAGADGYLLLEVPDCERDLRLHEYSSIWEEHTIYFTKQTLSRCLERAGLEIVRFQTYTYPYELVSSVLV